MIVVAWVVYLVYQTRILSKRKGAVTPYNAHIRKTCPAFAVGISEVAGSGRILALNTTTGKRRCVKAMLLLIRYVIARVTPGVPYILL